MIAVVIEYRCCAKNLNSARMKWVRGGVQKKAVFTAAIEHSATMTRGTSFSVVTKGTWESKILG